jgi:hypothetical protein
MPEIHSQFIFHGAIINFNHDAIPHICKVFTDANNTTAPSSANGVTGLLDAYACLIYQLNINSKITI